jgi:hypothetical protein
VATYNFLFENQTGFLRHARALLGMIARSTPVSVQELNVCNYSSCSFMREHERESAKRSRYSFDIIFDVFFDNFMLNLDFAQIMPKSTYAITSSL